MLLLIMLRKHYNIGKVRKEKLDELQKYFGSH